MRRTHPQRRNANENGAVSSRLRHPNQACDVHTTQIPDFRHRGRFGPGPWRTARPGRIAGPWRAAHPRGSAQLLKDSAGLYLYTSSTGVYYPYYGSNLTEDTPLVLEAGAAANEDLAYGVMKAQSEIEARMAFGEGRTIVVRPTYIVGPGDTSNRFPYWPARLERGGEVLVPGKPDDPVQWVDVRDLTEWMIRLIETGNAGTFNAVAPRGGRSGRTASRQAGACPCAGPE